MLAKNPLKRQAQHIVGEAIGNWGRGRNDYATFDNSGDQNGLVTGARFDPDLYHDDEHPDVCTGKCSENRFGNPWVPVEEFGELIEEEIPQDEFAKWLFLADEEPPEGDLYSAAKAELDAHNNILQKLEEADKHESPIDSTATRHSSNGWIGRKGKLIVRGLVGHALLFKL